MAVHGFQGGEQGTVGEMASPFRSAARATGSQSRAAKRGSHFPHLELHRRGTAVRGVPPFRTSSGE